jgi:hypothetical protein
VIASATMVRFFNACFFNFSPNQDGHLDTTRVVLIIFLIIHIGEIPFQVQLIASTYMDLEFFKTWFSTDTP